MRFLDRAAIAMAFALPLSALPVSAQHYKWDVTAFGGYSWLTGNLFDRNDFDFFDNDVDLFDDDFDNDVSLGNGGNVGAQLGYWFNKRFGLRANFMYTASDVDRPRLFFDGIDDNLLIRPFTFFDHDVNIWNGTGDLMIRLNTPRTRWDGFEWLPYVALGLGATWINPAGHEINLVDAGM